MADVKFGIKTGCNEFFIVKNITHAAKETHFSAAVNNFDDLRTSKDLKQHKLKLVENGFNEIWLIEEQFLKPMLTSPKDVSAYEIKISALTYSILLLGVEKKELKKEYPYVFRYIQYAEKQNIHHRSTLASRSLWYNIGERNLPDMSFNYIINEYGRTFKIAAYSNNNFHNIYVKKTNIKSLWFYMNSTISYLIQQLIMRSNLGDGAGKIETYELSDFPIINVDLERLEINLGETKNYKEEFGSLETLKTVNPERLKLDSAILEAIGYKQKKERDEVLLELYRSTFQLINARLQKAQSQKGVKAQRNKVAFSVYVEQLKILLHEANVPAKSTLTFAKQINKFIGQITSESKLQKKILDVYWKEKFGELYNEKKIADNMQGKMF